MRRRRRLMTPSLFPFLSVLVCVIGALVLIMAIQIVTDAGERASLPEVRYAMARAAIAADRARRDRLVKQAARWGPLSQAIGSADEKVRDLAEQLRRLEVGRDRALQLSHGVLILPAGLSRRTSAAFVECRSSDVRLHEPGQPIHTVALSTLWESERWLSLIGRVASHASALLVVLIREDGVGCYDQLEQSLLKRSPWLRSRLAKLAIPGSAAVDLRAMAGFEEE